MILTRYNIRNYAICFLKLAFFWLKKRIFVSLFQNFIFFVLWITSGKTAGRNGAARVPMVGFISSCISVPGHVILGL